MTFRRNALMGVIAEPLCEEYRKHWMAAGDDKKRLFRMAMRVQSIPYLATYCAQGKGLTKDYLLSEFKDYINGHTEYDCDDIEGFSYQLYAGKQDERIDLPIDVAHFMFVDDASVFVPKTKCPRIYVSNKSNVSLVLCGYNSVQVYLFDESNVYIEDADDESEVVVYKYSDDCSVLKGDFCLCGVKEHRKELRI